MKKQAKLIVHTGSMFSGKTTSLWRELYRMKIAGYKTMPFKPSVDTRHKDEKIISHDNLELDAIQINSIKDIFEYSKKNQIDAIGIDEVQFFPDNPNEIVDYFVKLIKNHITIVVSGLDMDYKANPFEIVKELMPIADELIKHHAICASCGEDAWVSFRKSYNENRIEIGAQDSYEPLCRSCYRVARAEDKLKENQEKFL